MGGKLKTIEDSEDEDVDERHYHNYATAGSSRHLNVDWKVPQCG